MNEERWMIALGIWSNIVATITLIVTIKDNQNKKPPRKPSKRKRKR